MTEERNNSTENTPAAETFNEAATPATETIVPAKSQINPLLLALNLVMLAGLIILYILHFTGSGKSGSSISGAIEKSSRQ